MALRETDAKIQSLKVSVLEMERQRNHKMSDLQKTASQ